MADDNKDERTEGSRLRSGLHKIADSVADGVVLTESVARSTYTAARNYHHQVQEHGGYGHLIGRRVRSGYKTIEETFCTDGGLDEIKTKEALRGVVTGAKQRVQNLWYKKFPTPEEKATIYEGIGTGVKGFITRDTSEKCLHFYHLAKVRIPEEEPLREGILADIKASVRISPVALDQFYVLMYAMGRHAKSSEIIQRMQVIQKYFPELSKK